MNPAGSGEVGLPVELARWRDRRAVLDLARVALLAHPDPLDVSDEWPLLASAVTGRSYTVADLALALQDAPELFQIETVDGLVQATLRDDALEVVALGIEPSASEHFRFYLALRSRGLTSWLSDDESDRTVARLIPRQAALANAIEALCNDPLATLQCDVHTLTRVLESPGDHLDSPPAAAVYQALHFLEHAPRADRASYLLMAARKQRADLLVRELEQYSGLCWWEPLWNWSQPTSPARIVVRRTSAALCSAVAHHRGSRVEAIGYADGTVVICCNEQERCTLGEGLLADGSVMDGEVRAIDVASDGDDLVVAVGCSDESVLVVGLDGDVWFRGRSHTSPLSSVCAWFEEGSLVVGAADVDGLLCTWRLRAGEPIEAHRRAIGSEARVLGRAADGLVWVTVDGRIGGGELFTHGTDRVVDGGERHGVATSSTAMPADPRSRVVGTSSGEALLVSQGSSGWAIEQVAEIGAPINDVAARPDGALAFACGDSSLRVVDSWGGAVRTLKANHAQVHGCAWLDGGDGARLLSAASDGTARVTSSRFGTSDAVPRAASDQITTIDVLDLGPGGWVVVLGHADGTVRVAGTPFTGRGAEVAKHFGAVRALHVSRQLDDTVRIISGSSDGALYRTVVAPDGAHTSEVLGTAHDGVSTLSALGGGDGDLLASGGADGGLAVWDLDRSEVAHTRQVAEFGSIAGVAFVRQAAGLALVVATESGRTALFRPQTLEPLAELRATIPASTMIGFGESMPHVVIGAPSGAIAVRRGLELQLADVASLPVHTTGVVGLASLRSGGLRLLFSASTDRFISAYTLRTLEQFGRIELDGVPIAIGSSGGLLAIATSTGASVLAIRAANRNLRGGLASIAWRREVD